MIISSTGCIANHYPVEIGYAHQNILQAVDEFTRKTIAM